MLIITCIFNSTKYRRLSGILVKFPSVPHYVENTIGIVVQQFIYYLRNTNDPSLETPYCWLESIELYDLPLTAESSVLSQ